MADTPQAEVSKVSRAKGKVKKSWISVKSRFKKTIGIKQPVEIISSPHTQVEIDPHPKEPTDIVPPPRETYTSGHVPAPEDDRTCTSLSGLSGLQKLENDLRAEPTNPLDHTVPTNDHTETTPQRQGTCPNESVSSDVAVFGDSEEGTSGDMITPAVARGTPVQPMPLRRPPVRDTPVQIQRNVGKARSPVPVPTPVPAPAHPRGKVFILTPNKHPMLLDPQNAQPCTPIKPANHLQSPSPCMVIPGLGASPLSKQIPPAAPNSPEIPPTPLKHQRLMPETIDPLLAGQCPPLPPRSPRRPPLHNVDPILPADDEKKDCGVIGDRRAAKNQPLPRPVEKLVDDPGNNKEVPPAKAEPTQGGVEGLQQREGIAQIPVGRRHRPVYARQGKYYVGRCLGRGGMGDVYSVLDTESLSVSALKVIGRSGLGCSNLSDFKAELDIMKRLTEMRQFYSVPAFRFLIHLVESWYDKDNIYISMPLCVGSLRDCLRTIKLAPLTIKVYAAELMSGVEALHGIKVIHFDLKPENVLLSPDGHLKISDFGISVSWLDRRYRKHPRHAFRGRRLGGTDGYMAPEVASVYLNPGISHWGNYGFAADIFSLGIIFAELNMGGSRFVDFEDEEEMKCWKGDYPYFAKTMVLSPERLSKRAEKNLRGDHLYLVERMIEIKEASRATMDEIASHPFFSELDMERVLDKGYPVPFPSLDSVLPCHHMLVEDIWFERNGHSGGPDKPASPGAPDYYARHSGVVQDIDQLIVPESFVWNADQEKRRRERRRKQQEAAQAQCGSQCGSQCHGTSYST